MSHHGVSGKSLVVRSAKSSPRREEEATARHGRLVGPVIPGIPDALHLMILRDPFVWELYRDTTSRGSEAINEELRLHEVRFISAGHQCAGWQHRQRGTMRAESEWSGGGLDIRGEEGRRCSPGASRELF